MKRNYLKNLFLCLCLFAGTSAFAQSGEIDGISYNFTNSHAEVTSGKGCSGEITIPESVSYNGATYDVEAIGNDAFHFFVFDNDVFNNRRETAIDFIF